MDDDTKVTVTAVILGFTIVLFAIIGSINWQWGRIDMKCFNCDKVIKQTDNRPKLYCSDACRKAYYRSIGLVIKDPNE